MMKLNSIEKGIAVVALSLGTFMPVHAQQSDPALTAAVIAQTVELKNIHKQRKKTQEKIIAAETAVTLALDRVHGVENKLLEYLSNAQGAMQNLYQIKRALGLCIFLEGLSFDAYALWVKGVYGFQ